MDMTQSDRTGAEAGKPRLALMGEFSAGKSTLSNILLGGRALPMRVTATRLPPVWVSYGPDRAVCVGQDGSETEIAPDRLDQVDLDQTRMIRLQMEADALQLCDLIDMPGISDPNMSSGVWQALIDEVDSVVWCTHATQAWRQSEAATWDQIVERTNGRNLLLISQIDKLAAGRDRARVLARVRKETAGLFRGVYPVALLEALNAGDDAGRWAESGAAAFIETLVEMLMEPPAQAEAPVEEAEATEPAPEATPAAAETGDRILPKRVKANRALPPRARLQPREKESLLF
ncbi:hypothetical protein CVM52_22290 [Pseudooceanicola lipolyticus]|uniref:Dynamin N-terminal domain-containing protein n=1 Tax=Pseudooceanicola lipolyticus TaxID=2029104 RepID=A0A2M8IV81_9RHOB|nr:dynamin family protein [Pseudooceanicola lipolyticus]PJE34431.1 hypothetical protein CVM52_22290 [Pseudooceanicola lipolyticus]